MFRISDLFSFVMENRAFAFMRFIPLVSFISPLHLATFVASSVLACLRVRECELAFEFRRVGTTEIEKAGALVYCSRDQPTPAIYNSCWNVDDDIRV